jgi:hypothetical protein
VDYKTNSRVEMIYSELKGLRQEVLRLRESIEKELLQLSRQVAINSLAVKIIGACAFTLFGAVLYFLLEQM